MELIDRYLQAVGFWLPRSQKQDILAELSEDIHSQMEEREAELRRPLDAADVAAILKQRGHPMLVAGKFLPQRHLIGPVLFPTYVFVLKIAGLCYLIPWGLVWLGILIFDRTQTVVQVPLDRYPFGTMWTLLWTIFGVITVIFAVVERIWTKEPPLQDWDPYNLPKVRQKRETKRRWEAIAGIVFGIGALWWLLALPNYPFLILGPMAYMFKAAPIVHVAYPYLFVLGIVGIVENVFALLRPELRWVPALRLGSIALCIWVVRILLQSRTYMIAVDPRAAQAAVAVNQVLVICMVCAEVGLIIALFLQAWQTVQALRQPVNRTVPYLA